MEHLLLLLHIMILIKDSVGGPYEKELLKALLRDYEIQNRPVLNESAPLELTFGVSLQQIIDVDEKNQLLITCLWLNLGWNDYQMQWNKTDYGEVESIRIHPKLIWTPDLLMYNSADEKFDGTFQTNVVVSNDGGCLYVPPGLFKSTCKIDITWFPFDDQLCDLKFGSWTYSGWKVDLVLNKEDGGDVSSFITNGEWDLIGLPGKKNSVTYDCCPEPYVDITFTIHIRRRTLYYFFNLIVPCVLISSMALLGFTLPPDSGEKLTLGVTILLSLTVFMNMVSEIMPRTSDAVPLIGTYFNCIMMMVASSVVLTVVVLNYHHRTAETHVMPMWVRSVFLQWLPWILRMDRPRKRITRKTIMMSNRMKDLELKEKDSKSLMANVLDMDDDFRPQVGGPGVHLRSNGFCQDAGLAYTSGALANSHSSYTHSSGALGNTHNSYTHGSGGLGNGQSSGALGNPHNSYIHSSWNNVSMGQTKLSAPTTPRLQHAGSSQFLTPACSANNRELQNILREVRFMTNRLKVKDEEDEVVSDWKFAAMVIDRFCLITFTTFTAVTTATVLLSAPHVLVE